MKERGREEDGWLGGRVVRAKASGAAAYSDCHASLLVTLKLSFYYFLFFYYFEPQAPITHLFDE